MYTTTDISEEEEAVYLKVKRANDERDIDYEIERMGYSKEEIAQDTFDYIVDAYRRKRDEEWLSVARYVIKEGLYVTDNQLKLGEEA